MRSKRRRLKNSSLCVIIDRSFLSPEKCVKTAERALKGGADIIQFRCKNVFGKEAAVLARRLKRLAGKHCGLFIVNDRADIAAASDADGLHVGQGDISVAFARKIAGDKIIGVSARNIKQARKAKVERADYIGAGPVFKTPVKLGIRPKGIKLLESFNGVKLPVFAIGGIDKKAARILARAGFKKIAVIRAVSFSNDPYIAAKELKKALDRNDTTQAGKKR